MAITFEEVQKLFPWVVPSQNLIHAKSNIHSRAIAAVRISSPSASFRSPS